MLVWFVYATKSQRATAKSHAATLSRDEVTRLYHRAIKSQVWHRSNPYLNLDLDLCLRWVTLSCRVCLADYGQTWRHPQNRKYIPCHNVNWPKATGNMHRTFVWSFECRSWEMQADRRTNRHAHHNTLLSYGGSSIKRSKHRGSILRCYALLRSYISATIDRRRSYRRTAKTSAILRLYQMRTFDQHPV